MSELPPSDEERRAAAELAEQLESRDPKAAHDGDDALATAQLLRHSRTGGELDELALARTRPKLPSRRPSVAAWLGVAAVLVLVVSAVVVHWRQAAMAAAQAERANFELALSAQRRAIARHDPHEIEKPLRDYRAQMLASLEQKYRSGK